MSGRREGNQEGDVVLIHYQDKPMAYARIDAIRPDQKKDWYQVTLLFLTIPAKAVTWILRSAYINGDPFTMGGQPVKLEKVERILRKSEPEEGDSREQKSTDKITKVIPF